MNIIQIAFDALGKSTVTLTKNIQQGDHLTNKLRVTFYEGHPTISTVRLHAQKPDGSVTPIITSFESAFQDDIWEYPLESWFTEYAGILTISVSVQYAGEVEGYETADIILYDDYAALEAAAVTDDTKALVTLDDSKVFVYDTNTSTYEEQTGLSYEIPKEFQRAVKLNVEKSIISSGVSNLPPTSEPYILLLINNNATRISILENTSNDHEERLDAAEPIITSNTNRIVTLESDKADKTELAVETLRIDRILDGTTIVPKAYADEDGTNIKANYVRLGDIPNVPVLDESGLLPNSYLQGSVRLLEDADSYPYGVTYFYDDSGQLKASEHITVATSIEEADTLLVNYIKSNVGAHNFQISNQFTNGSIRLGDDFLEIDAGHGIEDNPLYINILNDIYAAGDIIASASFKSAPSKRLVIEDGISANQITMDDGGIVITNTEGFIDIHGKAYTSIWSTDNDNAPLKINAVGNAANILELNYHNSLVARVSQVGVIYCNGFNITGDIIQEGSPYETHAEHIYTTKDHIILRDGAVGGLAVSAYAGLIAKIPDGTNDASLVFDGNGMARVGDITYSDGSPVYTNTQALATRQDSPTSNGVPYWNASAYRFDTDAGITISSGNLILSGSKYISSNDIRNTASLNNSNLVLATTGTTISRNVADAYPALKVNNILGTSNIAEFQFGSANKLEITKDGFITQNGTSILSVSATNRNAFGFGASATENNSVVLGNTDITKTILRGNVGINQVSPTSQLHIVSSAVDKVGLIVAGDASATANIFEFKKGTTNLLYLNTSGELVSTAPAYFTSIINPTSANNSRIYLNTTGTEIRRNIADADNTYAALKINNAQGNGDIVKFQYGATEKANIDKDGNINIASGSHYKINGTALAASDVGAVASNTAITGATKTKITYDAKGLVTAGADATLDDIADGSTRKLSDYALDTHTQAVNKGGTNITTYAKGDILYSDATNSLAKLTIGTENQVLSVSSTGVPEWKTSGTSYAGTTETLLATRTATGTFSVTDLNTYDFIILELDAPSTYGEVGVEMFQDTYTERTQLNIDKFSYEYTEPMGVATHTRKGIKLTSYHYNATSCHFSLVPANAAKTSVELMLYGTAPSSWKIRIYGGTW